ncbi:unnamed protein product [Lampetra planeri]
MGDHDDCSSSDIYSQQQRGNDGHSHINRFSAEHDACSDTHRSDHHQNTNDRSNVDCQRHREEQLWDNHDWTGSQCWNHNLKSDLQFHNQPESMW